MLKFILFYFSSMNESSIRLFFIAQHTKKNETTAISILLIRFANAYEYKSLVLQLQHQQSQQAAKPRQQIVGLICDVPNLL